MSVNPQSVADYLTIAPLTGLPAGNFVPQSFRAQAATVAQRNIPTSAPPSFVTVCTASLIARGIIYWKDNPGDCGSQTQVDFSDASATQQIGSTALGIASMAGASLPGIGSAINLIAGIFAHHDQTVATEQTTICRVASIINQVFKYYDNLVISGRISPSSAYQGMQTFLNQAISQLSTIEKTCNAACVYIAILRAHSDFVESYYPAIAPVSGWSHAPGAPPATLNTTPGGVIYSGGGLATGVLPTSIDLSFSWTEILVVLGVLLALFVVISLAT